MTRSPSQFGLWRAPAWVLLTGLVLASGMVGPFAANSIGIAPGTAVTLASLVSACASSVLPLLALGLLLSAASVGPRATLAGLAWACGSRDRDPLPAARALAAGARGLIAGALLLGLIGVMMLVFFYRRGAADPPAIAGPQTIYRVLVATIMNPLVALLFGRLLCATVADAAFAAAGEVRRRALGVGWDLSLLALMVPPIIGISSMFWHYPEL